MGGGVERGCINRPAITQSNRLADGNPVHIETIRRSDERKPRIYFYQPSGVDECYFIFHGIRMDRAGNQARTGQSRLSEYTISFRIPGIEDWFTNMTNGKPFYGSEKEYS